MGSAADPEIVVRLGDIQDVEEDPGHVLVVVLARVDEDLLMVLPNLAAHGGCFDELRACPNDARDLHMSLEETARYNRSLP
jgi:hypothetical protein